MLGMWQKLNNKKGMETHLVFVHITHLVSPFHGSMMMVVHS